jgi:two-component system, OmpR family, response regulator
MSSRCLLVVDDDPAVRQLLASVVPYGECQIQNVSDVKEALSRFEETAFDVIFVGQGRNGFDGIDLLRRVRQIRPEAKVILAGSDSSLPKVVGAMRERAYSYFHKPLPRGPLADMVQQALEGGSCWQDDIELVSARPEWITLEVRCKVEVADRVIQFLREMQPDVPAYTRDDILLALREMLLNAIEHGGRNDAAKRVRVSVLRTPNAIMAHLRDPGPGFAMDSIPHAAVSNPNDSPIQHVEIRTGLGKRPGGFGILLARNLVDELLYNEKGNEVWFRKQIRRDSG